MSWGEILVVAVIALIVVGPKDLPGMFREVGRFTARVRAMARDFSRAMEDAADQAGVKDVAKTFKAASNPKSFGLDTLNKTLDDVDLGPETKKLSEERAEAARKIHEATAARAKDSAAKAEEASPPPPAATDKTPDA